MLRVSRLNKLSNTAAGPSPSSPKSSPKTEDQIIEFLRQDASITTEELGKAIGVSKRAVLKQVDKLKEQGRLRRIGPPRGGHWEIVDKSDE
jgi:ATP-dependent DNA helicase RecG